MARIEGLPAGLERNAFASDAFAIGHRATRYSCLEDFGQEERIIQLFSPNKLALLAPTEHREAQRLLTAAWACLSGRNGGPLRRTGAAGCQRRAITAPLW